MNKKTMVITEKWTNLFKERTIVELRRAGYGHTAEKMLTISEDVRNELINKFYL